MKTIFKIRSNMNEEQTEIKKTNRLPIKEFSLKSFVTDPSIIIIAKRGCGMNHRICQAILDHNLNNEIPKDINCGSK